MSLIESKSGSRLTRQDLTSDLVSAVVRTMTDQDLSPGEKLSSQRELAERFGVAVPTMREALRRLEGMGVLTFRHGSGIYVGENFNRSVVPNVVLPPADSERLVALIEARALIEPGIAAEAAMTQDQAGIEKLRSLIDQAAASLRNGDGQLWKINIDIHRAIASVAGNSILEEVLHSLLLIHAEDQRQILLLHGDPETDLAEHQELASLTIGGKVREAGELMRKHLDEVVAALKSSFHSEKHENAKEESA